MMSRYRLLYISSSPARDTTSGAVLVHRHFSLLGDEYEIHRLHEAPPEPGEQNYTQLAPNRLHHRLMHSRLRDLTEHVHQARGFFHSRKEIRNAIRRVRPHAILTAAESTIYMAVADAARATRTPLGSFFHDWSPGWPGVPESARVPVTEAFRRIYWQSKVAFCICEEIREELGGHACALVLPPIPSTRADTPAGGKVDDFEMLYAGVCHQLYAEEMQSLCRLLARAGQADRLRIIGPTPWWPGEDGEILERHGFHHGLRKDDLAEWLARASMHLVVSPFSKSFEAYARYSFPSKIPEYARLGKPMLIWGPPYAASVRWAKRTGAALAVDDANPESLIKAADRLHNDASLREDLERRIAREYDRAFSPDKLQGIFEEGLAHLLEGRSASV